MQAIKDKMHDISEMRKVKAEAKEEERAEKDLAKARMEVAREVRLAKEAEAAMDLHVNKAADKVRRHEDKYPTHTDQTIGDNFRDQYGHNSGLHDSTKSTYAGSNAATGMTGYANTSNITGGRAPMTK